MAEPRSLDSALGRIIGSMTSSQGPMMQIIESWSDVVGDAVANHARPRRLTDGVLTVEVDDPAWATQLKFLREQICSKLNERLGRQEVDRVDLRVVAR